MGEEEDGGEEKGEKVVMETLQVPDAIKYDRKGRKEGLWELEGETHLCRGQGDQWGHSREEPGGGTSHR